MRNEKWLLSLLWLIWLLLGAANHASAATYFVSVVDDVDLHDFDPPSLTINVGDRVSFLAYGDFGYSGPHNVVADDGSFRCARGCDDEGGGDGAPADVALQWIFSRVFNIPGSVRYHDEVTGATGVIIVQQASAPAPAFAIGPGITGMWFNPAQNGHGFMLEALPGPPVQLLTTWFVFGPQGGQDWVQGLGPINGDKAVLQAYQALGAGGKFPPNFDPANVHIEGWGTLTFTFTDCNNGHVDWVSTIPGYSNGGMDLVRLTQPAGLTCP